MKEFIKRIFKKSQTVDFKELWDNGAQIIDVRNPGEFKGGHIENSVNIPLNILTANIPKLKKDQAVITCCASGVRSISAKKILQANGFVEVHNGGGWRSLAGKIK